MNAFSSLNVFQPLNALLLTGTLLSAGCGDEDVNPVEPVGPAPIQTVASEDLAEQADGCLYGTTSFTLVRESREANLIVAVQTNCPASYFIEGICSPTLHYDDGTAPHYKRPRFDGVCFNPQVGPDNGLEPCRLGALVCAVDAPADTVESYTDNSGDTPTTTYEEIAGPSRIDVRQDIRCCPSR